MDRPSDQVTAQQTEEDLLDPKDKRDKRGLTKEQRDQLAALREEQEKARKERVDKLTEKLLDRISVWAETDKGPDVTEAFRSKMRLEVEELKMESFGIDICHAIGQVYLNKGSTLLRSQKFFGIGGFFSRIRDKGTMIKDTWNTISSAMEAQAEMERMAKQEEEAGEDWTDERQEEAQRRVTGKILGAAWKGSKFEIQDVLRSVCDNVLNDKKVPLSKRLERAQALVLIGDVFSKVCFTLFMISENAANMPTGGAIPRRGGRLPHVREARCRSGRQGQGEGQEEEQGQAQERRRRRRAQCAPTPTQSRKRSLR